MQKLFLFAFFICISMQVVFADRTDEFKIYGKIKSINLKTNTIEIVNGENPRVFNCIHITKIFSNNKEIKISELKNTDIVEIQFWHDGEIKGRNNIVTAVYVIKH